MRNAAVPFDDDFDLDEPARKPKAARKPRGAPAKKKVGGRGKKVAKRRFAHYAAVGLSATLVVGIMINALVLQHSRHPAPLFGKAIQLGADPAPAALAALPPSKPLPAPVARPQARQAEADAPDDDQPAAPATPPLPPAPHPHHAAGDATPAKVRTDDPIGRLLKATTPGGSDRADKSAEKENPRTVTAAQHALLKLGFVVKPDGTLGPTTKAAIEAFERDKHLPVTGELNHKVLRQLAAESGIAIN